MKRTVALVLVIGLFAASLAHAASEARVVSPDTCLEAKVFLHEGQLKLSITRDSKTILESSPLVMILDGTPVTEGITFGEVHSSKVKETYPYRGVHSLATNEFNGVRIPLDHAKTGTKLTLELRAFNDAVAFRFLIPEGKGSRTPDEATRFVFPAGSTVWYHDLNGHYEGVHDKKAIADVAVGAWAAPPVTFQLPGDAGYASITEAALVNYGGIALQADGQRGFQIKLGHEHPVSYPYKLRYTEEDITRLSKPAAITGAITTPWRIVMVAADLNALVNCDAVANLSPPPDPKLFPQGQATDWIKPGRAVWKYLDGGENTLEGMKEFCRLAGELGFEHNVIEGFWKKWSDEELKQLVAIGKENRVGIWLWKHSKELRDPEARRAFFRKCQDFGVVGVKLDFFDHEAKEMIDFYQTLLKETAEHKLLVNFHGSNKPSGEARTWPNELVRESVRGMEASKLQTRARHDATLPFTRYLAGHADYTPVHFGARRADTTAAHQIATAAVFTAPLLTYGAHPKTLLAHPAVAMIKSIPAIWDETRVLPPSEIGEVAVFARRHGDTWFLAIVNGPTARSLRVPLTFLGKGEYHTLMVRDQGSDPIAVQVEEGKVKAGDELAVELNAGGGFIGRFSIKTK